jgi:hypothetical protein
VKSGRAAS